MISIIVAIGKNNELGKNNDLIWHMKEDLKNFKKLTMGKKIVMGANTYKSLPKKLEGREYIILSSHLKSVSYGKLFNNFDDLLKYLNSLTEEVMVIGGAQIYKLFLPYAKKMYITEIDSTYDADVYFPSFSQNDYKKTILQKNQENNINYNFVLYERK